MTHHILPQGTCITYMFCLLVWVSCVWQLQTCPVPARLWGCVHLFTDAVHCFFPSKLCMSPSIPSKTLDAKSPQGMCQRLLNTLCTLSLILHGCGFTVGEMQMAAHGIALWGNKENTAYFSNAGFIFSCFDRLLSIFFAVWTASVPLLTCLRHSSIDRNFYTWLTNLWILKTMKNRLSWQENTSEKKKPNPLIFKKQQQNPSSLCICPWTLEEGSHRISVLKFVYSQSKFPIIGLEKHD